MGVGGGGEEEISYAGGLCPKFLPFFHSVPIELPGLGLGFILNAPFFILNAPFYPGIAANPGYSAGHTLWDLALFQWPVQ